MKRWVLVASLVLCAVPCKAEEVHVAVASNFRATLDAMARAFEARTGHRMVISSGSTGKLYAQISHGAPFDVLLAADAKHPSLLTQQGLAVEGTGFPYAIGRLVLWSPDPTRISDGPTALRKDRIRHLAIANPKTAPYGAAAQEALRALELWNQLRPLIVQGENVAQVFQFVASGAADLGFVALSDILNPHGPLQGSRWIVPQELYTPLEQHAILLRHGTHSSAARDVLMFLKSPSARSTIEQFGYGLQ